VAAYLYPLLRCSPLVVVTDDGAVGGAAAWRGERRGEEVARDHAKEDSSLHHSITWSARCSSDCGIVRPRALAVLRLMTSSKQTRERAGSSVVAPLSIFDTYMAARRNSSVNR